MTTQTVANPRT